MTRDALPPGEPVRHGLTTDDVNRLAGTCARNAFAGPLTFDERHDAAVLGVLVAILEAETRPAARAMLNAGRDAISRAAHAEQKQRGYDRENGRTRPGYVRYWHGSQALVSPFEEDLVERIALWQIWAGLRYEHQQTLWALAIKDSHEQAALWCGITLTNHRERLSQARRAFRRAWFYPEQAPPFWGRDTRRAPGNERHHTVMQVRRNNGYFQKRRAAGE